MLRGTPRLATLARIRRPLAEPETERLPARDLPVFDALASWAD